MPTDFVLTKEQGEGRKVFRTPGVRAKYLGHHKEEGSSRFSGAVLCRASQDGQKSVMPREAVLGEGVAHGLTDAGVEARLAPASLRGHGAQALGPHIVLLELVPR